MNILLQDIKYLQGVGPQRAELLANELNIHTLGDLLSYYPYKYVDRSRIYRISELSSNMPYIQVCVEILSFEQLGEGSSKRLIAHFSDGTGVIDLVWFQGIKYAAKNYDCRKPYVVFGKPSVFNGRIQVAHPEIENAPANMRPQQRPYGYVSNLFGTSPSETASPTSSQSSRKYSTSTSNPNLSDPTLDAQPSAYKGLCPSYNTTEKMKRSGLASAGVAKLTANMFKLLSAPLRETLPQYIIEKYKFVSYDEAIRNIHYPSSPETLRRAQLRLKFEELFYVQLNILRYVKNRQLRYQGLIFKTVGSYFNGFYFNHLPFSLT